MGFLSALLGGAAAEPIKAIGEVFDGLFTSDEERLDKKIIMERLKQNPALAQAAINKAEAQHRSIFVAGGRPFIMWVCGLGLAYAFLINPTIQWLTGMPGPQLPTSVMMDLVLGMLGLSVLRTVEKLAGRTK